MSSDEDTFIPAPDSGAVDWANRVKHRVFGAKAALVVEEDTTRQGIATLALEMATATAPRTYDWSTKVRLQLTQAELLAVASVLLGLRQRTEGAAHGPNNDKGFVLGWHDGALLCRLNAPGRSFAVKVNAEDRYLLAALAVRQIQAITPWLDTAGIIAILTAVAQPRESRK